MEVGTLCPCVAEISATRLIVPSGEITSSSPWVGATAESLPRTATMLYHVPSGSKSPGLGCATGCDFRKALRSATMLQVPFGNILRIALVVSPSPGDHPAPAVNAYIVLPMNATSATPLT